jgi:hypothetical protein
MSTFRLTKKVERKDTGTSSLMMVTSEKLHIIKLLFIGQDLVLFIHLEVKCSFYSGWSCSLLKTGRGMSQDIGVTCYNS